jgi:excinuclease UvrABC ATPase subunit
MSHNNDRIILQGVRTHNLKDIDVQIPKNQITTITGVSGSGKSSLAFETIYKEGQFRYIESLSSYLRNFFSLGTRPEIDYSEGLSPAIAIEQNKRVANSRSSVGTITELDDYLRLLMTKCGNAYCYKCGTAMKPKNTEQILEEIRKEFMDQKVYLLQEMKSYEEQADLAKFVRKNRRQTDAGEGTTRYLVGTNRNKEERTYKNLVEYFYLEEPSLPHDAFPVQVFGIFDRIQITEQTLSRLREDSIKMLSRTEKFGVKRMES